MWTFMPVLVESRLRKPCWSWFVYTTLVRENSVLFNRVMITTTEQAHAGFYDM